MPIIDYSNISTYNISAMANVDSFAGLFKAIDNIFGIPYLFGIFSLFILYVVLLLIFRDYDFKVSSITASSICLLISIFYYFAHLIAWEHLLVIFGIYLLSLLATWKWTE